MNIILSIKPEFCDALLQGKKSYEFRKRIFKKRDGIEHVFVYSTYPIQKIVGAFTIDSILHDNPQTLWKKCKDGAGISKEFFFSYFGTHSKGYAIKVDEILRFEPIDPKSVVPDFNPPQSFCYTNHTLQNLIVSQS
jgi:predicted transcriptional regulator